MNQVEKNYATVLVIGIILVVIMIIGVEMTKPKSLDTDEYYNYYTVTREQCFNELDGMWSNTKCVSKIPVGLERCIDTTYGIEKNFGIWYCNPEDVEIDREDMECDYDVYGEKYCLVRDN